ncbi:HNH endonuclease family protein [Azospirillum sp. SYSU D00513]|uniref:HNH endonuclease family protein n=1 Tax=Azospirillum sp. SYSU D00513 TaxID=2812561 RepID=UPI001FFF41C5|nr:HNH endonuclease family protein [Azospirillum sp. SYSU D00513]
MGWNGRGAPKGTRGGAKRGGTSRSGGARRGRSLSLRGILLLVLILGAVFAAERFGVLPPGTLASLTGEEPAPAPRRTAERGPSAPPAQTRSPSPSAPADASIDHARVQAQLDGIRVEPEMRRGYRREDWPHWVDADRNCLNTREEVLIRDAAEPPRLATNGCSIQSGTWHDPYTGVTFHDPRKLDIDHRIPLEEAHNSGGHGWDRDRRQAFANDLSDPRTLVAVAAEANRAKGAKGPEEWLPPRREGLCLYIADWIAVKARWELSMDERERVTVGNILADCRNQVAERGQVGAAP